MRWNEDIIEASSLSSDEHFIGNNLIVSPIQRGQCTGDAEQVLYIPRKAETDFSVLLESTYELRLRGRKRLSSVAD